MDNFYSRCLLCTCRPDVTPHLHIFSDIGKQLQLADKIKLLNIQIEAELPQNVCHSCMEKLEVTHELVTSSQQARIMLLQIKQQSEKTNQESSDTTLELDSYQPATDSAAIDNEKENIIPMDNSDPEDFDQSKPDVQLDEEPNLITPCSPSRISSLEGPNENSEAFEEMLIPKIEIVELPINPEVEHMDQDAESEDSVDSESMRTAENETRILRNRQISYRNKNVAAHSKQNGHDRRKNTAQKEVAKQNGHRRKNLTQNNGVKQHRENTAKKNGLKCKICSLGFKSKVLMKNHVSDVHGTETVFKCTICASKSFATYMQLSLHCQESHSEALTCELCTAKFNSHRNLNRHVRNSHTGPMLQCDLCQYTTRRKDFLAMHLKSNHNSLFNETVSCEFCSATYTCNKYLQIHVKGKHTGPIMYCEHCTYSSRYKSSIVSHLKFRHFNRPNGQNSGRWPPPLRNWSNMSYIP